MPKVSLATGVSIRLKFSLVLACGLSCVAAKPEPNWQMGKVLETPITDSTTRWTKRGPYHDEGDAHVVTIQGGSTSQGATTYTLYEKRAWTSGCLLVAGDTVKYAAEGGRVNLMDSTGTKCKLVVVMTSAGR